LRYLEWKRNRREKASFGEHSFEAKEGMLPTTEILKIMQPWDGDIPHTEEARRGTDRVGVADDR